MTLHDRIRAVVEERLATARAACHDGSGRWHQRASFEDNSEWLSPRVDDENDDVVVYDEGSPTESEAAHIAANDPADAILSAEHALSVLDRHTSTDLDAYRYGITCSGCPNSAVSWPCIEMRELATRWRVEVDG